MSSMVWLTIQASIAEHSENGCAMVSPQVLVAQQLHPADIVTLRTRFGRTALVRVQPLPSDGDPGTIRLDGLVRQGIKVDPGDGVELRKLDGQVPVVQRLMLAPFLDVSGLPDLSGAVRDSLVQGQVLVSPNVPVVIRLESDGQEFTAPSSITFGVVEAFPGGGVVTRDTAIQLTGGTRDISRADVTFEDVGGLGAQMEQVREVIEMPLRFPAVYRRLGITPPRGALFYGPPGCGKSHLARAIANEVEAKFFYMSGPEIIASAYGETEANLRRIFTDAGRRPPAIIFVDELDAIASKRGETGSAVDTRVAIQFLTLLDGLRPINGVMVIGTTNRPESLDRAFRRPGRFDREIYIGPADATGRLEILYIHTRGMPLTDNAHEYLPRLAEATVGFSGADLMELCREAALNSMRRHLPRSEQSDLRDARIDVSQLVVTEQDLEEASGKIRPSALRETLMVPSFVTWEDIGGVKEAKARLQEVVEQPLRHAEAIKSMGIKPPMGVLLYGPPGTGKSLLAAAVAHHCSANFIPVRGSEFYSKWLGESEERVRHIFVVARQVAPCVIFIDQLDAIAPVRGPETGTTAVTQRVISQLQAELDTIGPYDGIVVIAATNRLDLVDEAVLSPGRFGVHIEVSLPAEEDRKEIVGIHIRKIPFENPFTRDEAATLVAGQTEGYSGTELAAICEEAKLLAARSAQYTRVVPLRREHLSAALKKVVSSRIGHRKASSPAGPAA